MDPLTFIRSVWSHQPDGHFFLCYFDGAHVFRERSFIRNEGWRRKPRLLSEGIDLYFCPNSFSAANRRNSYAQEGRWLYADLDGVNPESCRLRPTLAWRTSPGRYQAAWLLDRRLPPDQLSLLNRWMTYTTGADKGGWSLTKVLRMPGSVSHKRKRPFTVELLWGELRNPRPAYPAAKLLEVARKSKKVFTPAQVLDHQISEKSSRQLIKHYGTKLPASARKMLRATKEEAQRTDRSVMLWKLENMLLESGLPPGEVFVLAQGSAYNKYRGQDREQAQLWTEIERAASRIDTDKPPAKRVRRRKKRSVTARKTRRRTKWNSEPIRLKKFMAMDFPEPKWLVEGIWVDGAYGIVGGSWKSFKTTSLLDLALSVSSGDPFLSKFKVEKPGDVLYVFEEGTPSYIHHSLHRIMTHKGQAPSADKQDLKLGEDLGIHLWPYPGLNLTDPNGQRDLELRVKRLKPRLIILETLYLLTGGADETKAPELQPLLDFVAKLSRKYSVSVMVTHHYNKSTDSGKRPMARLSGHSILARWYESAVFIERIGEELDSRVEFQAEHRAKPGRGKMELIFRLGDDQDEKTKDAYDVEIIEATTGTVPPDEIAADFGRATDAPKSQQVSRALRRLVEDNRETGIPISTAAKNLGTSPQVVNRAAVKLKFKVKTVTINGRSQKVLVP